MRASKAERERHPPLRCWFCDQRHVLDAVLDNAILMSREPRDGGPYYLFPCPFCHKENRVEETPRGRWFSSPQIRIGLMDYLFTWAPGLGRDAEGELVLQALSWLRDNEDRRRYFFERDGDQRYSGSSLLRSLWPWGRSPATSAASARETARERPPQARDEERPPRSKPPPDDDDDDGDDNDARMSPRLLTPQEILGVAADATIEAIQTRFRALAKQYHPDKVHHLGPTFQAEAHRRFVELERAYRALLSRRRG